MFRDACVKENASGKFRSVFNTIGKKVVRYPDAPRTHLLSVKRLALTYLTLSPYKAPI